MADDMLTPDTPGLEALKLLDWGTEPDLVAAAVGHAKLALPEWEPRAGQTEMVLMESLAVMLGPDILAAQVLDDRVIEQLMEIRGITRSPGTVASGRVRIEVTNSAGAQIIPAGTRLRVTKTSTGEAFDLLTVDELAIITTEALSGEVTVEADTVGADLNGTPAGTRVDVVDSLPFIERVTLATDLTGGAGPETDAAFRGRAAADIARFKQSALTLPEDFTYEALTLPGVGRAKTVNNWDTTTATLKAGHVTVTVANTSGETLTTEQKSAVETRLRDLSLASLTVHVTDPTYTTVDLSVTVKPATGETQETVTAAIDAALRAWLTPATWPWASLVSQFGVVSQVVALPQVAQVITASADKTLPGVAPLPRLGTVTVEVA